MKFTLLKCSDCDHLLSKAAKYCVKCGAQQMKKTDDLIRIKSLAIIISSIFFVSWIISLFSLNEKPSLPQIFNPEKPETIIYLINEEKADASAKLIGNTLILNFSLNGFKSNIKYFFLYDAAKFFGGVSKVSKVGFACVNGTVDLVDIRGHITKDEEVIHICMQKDNILNVNWNNFNPENLPSMLMNLLLILC